jgi:hypothetical protein
MDLAYLLSVISGILGIFLLALTYTYIDKLEKTGCACAEHPYRNFLKKYTIFAIIFLAVMMWFPPAVAFKAFGPVAGIAIMAVKALFFFATIAFFIMALKYVRYLMKEKCKCSEDMRREVLYIWAILEIIIIAAIVIIPVIAFVSSSALALASSSAKEVQKHANSVMDAVVDPIKSIKKVPASLKKSLKMRK